MIVGHNNAMPENLKGLYMYRGYEDLQYKMEPLRALKSTMKSELDPKMDWKPMERG